MNPSSAQTPDPVDFTPQAAAKVKALIAQGDQGAQVLRVYIEGGGCSGFQYGFELEAAPGDDDTVVECDGIKLVVDPLSIQYLMGAKVDYLEDLQGARFVISNPNAKTTCGCGSSFAVG